MRGLIRSSKRLRDNEIALIEMLTSMDRNYQNLVIIVEGKRDERVLRDLGVSARIIRTQRGSNRLSLIEEILEATSQVSQILILTDFDKEGAELAKFLERELDHHKVIVLKRLRLEIRKKMGNWRCIEELVALFKRKDSPEPVR